MRVSEVYSCVSMTPRLSRATDRAYNPTHHRRCHLSLLSEIVALAFPTSSSSYWLSTICFRSASMHSSCFSSPTGCPESNRRALLESLQRPMFGGAIFGCLEKFPRNASSLLCCILSRRSWFPWSILLTQLKVPGQLSAPASASPGNMQVLGCSLSGTPPPLHFIRWCELAPT